MAILKKTGKRVSLSNTSQMHLSWSRSGIDQNCDKEEITASLLASDDTAGGKQRWYLLHLTMEESASFAVYTAQRIARELSTEPGMSNLYKQKTASEALRDLADILEAKRECFGDPVKARRF